MLKELFHVSAPFPTNRQTAVVYAEELVDGIKLWAKIDTVAVALAILLWAIGTIPAFLTCLVIILVVACPSIMTLGYYIGCLRYLTPQECYTIVRKRLAT